MKESSPRFSTPISTSRPRGTRLLTAFSPKLERTVRAFDYPGLEQWVRLEADPALSTFCEHPRRVGADNDGALIDFWVQRNGGEEMLVVDRGGAATKLPASLDGIPVRVVAAAELAAAAVWVSNWLRMIPVITATRGLAPIGLSKSLLALVNRPLALSFIEHQMSVGDPCVVRGAIFDLLRTGHLQAPGLHTHPLSLHTTVEPRA